VGQSRQSLSLSLPAWLLATFARLSVHGFLPPRGPGHVLLASKPTPIMWNKTTKPRPPMPGDSKGQRVRCVLHHIINIPKPLVEPVQASESLRVGRGGPSPPSWGLCCTISFCHLPTAPRAAGPLQTQGHRDTLPSKKDGGIHRPVMTRAGRTQGTLTPAPVFPTPTAGCPGS
jgi:hypothetical protein